ncbi:uncharacterized protein [Centruroides vittatus]|uniref:uncharacterized protein n=1 Tax=Centruroides vittatus TaxID=120091 RepID=UPI00350EA30B
MKRLSSEILLPVIFLFFVKICGSQILTNFQSLNTKSPIITERAMACCVSSLESAKSNETKFHKIMRECMTERQAYNPEYVPSSYPIEQSQLFSQLAEDSVIQPAFAFQKIPQVNRKFYNKFSYNILLSIAVFPEVLAFVYLFLSTDYPLSKKTFENYPNAALITT